MNKLVPFLVCFLFLGNPSFAVEQAINKDKNVKERIHQIIEHVDIKEVKQLATGLKRVSLDLPKYAEQTSWHSGVDSEWNDERVSRLVYYISHTENILQKVNAIEEDYMFIFKHRREDISAKQWLLIVGATVKKVSLQSKEFERKIAYLKALLPKVIKRTEQEYLHSTQEKHKLLKLRLKAQKMYFEAINGQSSRAWVKAASLS